MKIQEAIDYLQLELLKEKPEEVSVKLQFLAGYEYKGPAEAGHPIGISLEVQNFVGLFCTSEVDAAFVEPEALVIAEKDFAYMCNVLFWDAGFCKWVDDDNFYRQLRYGVRAGRLSKVFGQWMDEQGIATYAVLCAKAGVPYSEE